VPSLGPEAKDNRFPSDYLRSIENVFTRYPETMIVQVGLESPQPKNIYGQAWKFALEQTLKNNLHRDENGRVTCGSLGGETAPTRKPTPSYGSKLKEQWFEPSLFH
jgi:hypothetical protein